MEPSSGGKKTDKGFSGREPRTTPEQRNANTLEGAYPACLLQGELARPLNNGHTNSVIGIRVDRRFRVSPSSLGNQRRKEEKERCRSILVIFFCTDNIAHILINDGFWPSI